jgi:hypothetical protein
MSATHLLNLQRWVFGVEGSGLYLFLEFLGRFIKFTKYRDTLRLKFQLIVLG